MITNTKSIHTVANSIREMIDAQNSQQLKDYHKSSLGSYLRRVLSDAYVLYFAAHSAHWNVEGSNFPQYHTFFEKIYTEVYAELDDIAEKIRTINEYAPFSLKEILAHGPMEPTSVGSPEKMLSEIKELNDILIQSVEVAYRSAEGAGEIGISNFLQDLTDKQKKLGWMITSTLKGQ